MDRTERDIFREAARKLFDVTGYAMEHEQNILGIDPCILAKIAKLNSMGKYHVAEKANCYLTITVNEKDLAEQIELFNRLGKHHQLQDYFLLQQAPFDMMQALFHFTCNQFSWRRRMLGVYKQDSHRPPYCEPEEEQEIWQHLYHYRHLDETDRYLKAAELSGVTLQKVWSAAKTYSKFDSSNDHK